MRNYYKLIYNAVITKVLKVVWGNIMYRKNAQMLYQ